VTAAGIADGQRESRPVFHLEIVRERGQTRRIRNIAEALGKSYITADVMGILKIHHTYKRVFAGRRQEFHSIGTCPHILETVRIQGDLRVLIPDLDGLFMSKASQCPAIVSLAEMHRPVTCIGKQAAEGGQGGIHIGVLPFARIAANSRLVWQKTRKQGCPGRLAERAGGVCIVENRAVPCKGIDNQSVPRITSIGFDCTCRKLVALDNQDIGFLLVAGHQGTGSHQKEGNFSHKAMEYAVPLTFRLTAFAEKLALISADEKEDAAPKGQMTVTKRRGESADLGDDTL